MNRTAAPDDGAFATRLASCSPDDFDGHTEFVSLSPEQRIQWLEQAAWFMWECHKEAAPHGREEPSETVSPPHQHHARVRP